MTQIPHPRLWPLVLSLLVSTVLLPAESLAAARILDRIEVRSGTQAQEVHISFNQPVRYVTHAPAAR